MRLPAGLLRIRWSGLRQPTPAELARLTTVEHQRAARFLVEPARQRFLLGRTVLRAQLGAALGVPPAALQLELGQHGKPVVATPDPAPAFNLSHSGAVVVLAMAWCERLGVDVEAAGGGRDLVRLAERFFAPTEAAAVVTAGDPEGVFLHLWTAKEAWLKAVGAGLSIAPREVVVQPDPAAPPRLLALPSGHDPAAWRLVRVPLPVAATCTVALPAGSWRVEVEQLSGPRD